VNFLPQKQKHAEVDAFPREAQHKASAQAKADTGKTDRERGRQGVKVLAKKKN